MEGVVYGNSCCLLLDLEDGMVNIRFVREKVSDMGLGSWGGCWIEECGGCQVSRLGFPLTSYQP